MDSTLGKVLASILGLLALAGVIVAGIVGFSHAKTNAAVADVATLATRIHGDYVNNPAGYATLTNAVAIAAGDVPADMLQGSSVVNAWGSAVTIGPVAGNPKDFSINLGAVPLSACVQLLSTDGSLMGASVGGLPLAVPAAPAAAAKACSNGASSGMVPLSVQYGQSKMPLCTSGEQAFGTDGNATFSMPSGCSTLTAWMWGAAGSVSNENNGGESGAFVQGVLKNVTSGEAFSLQIGQGGSLGASTTFGGGGAGGVDTQSGYGYVGGSGGGASALFDAAGNLLMMAGGGGGAGVAASGNPGGNATLTAGGAGGASYGWPVCEGGTSGAQFQGGSAPQNQGSGGGGGGGYFGGGGGSSGADSAGCYWGAYGGYGSSYAAPSVSAVAIVNPSGSVAPNPVGYAQLGQAGSSAQHDNWGWTAGDGLIVLQWGP